MAAYRESIDIGRVIQRGFDTIGRNLAPFALLALLLGAIPAFAVFYPTLQGMEEPESPGVTLTPHFWGGTLFTWITGCLLQAAVVRAAIRDLRGAAPDVRGSMIHALKLLLPIVGLTILSWLLFFVGLIFLVVPGIIVYIVLILSVPVLVDERRGVFESMSRSAELTKGSRLRIFGLLLLFALFYILLTAAAGMVEVTGMWTGGGTGFGAALASSLVSAVVALVVAAMLASLYVEVRGVKEGATSDSLAAVFD